MNSRLSILIFSIVVAIWGSWSWAETGARPLNFQKVGADLTTTMLRCPERIWPNYSWRNQNVLMAAENHATMIWRGQTGEVSSLPSAQIPPDAFEDLYSFPSFEGGKAVALYLSAEELQNFGNTSNEEAFKIIVHEGFHLFGQAEWTSGDVIERGTHYPISALPRLYRRMMFDRLKEYFVSGGKSIASLAKATYWNTRWKTEFPEEFRISMDRTEGTAEYIEHLAVIISEGGCQVSESDIYTAAVSILNNEMGSSVSGSAFQLDREGYELGALAGLVLRFINGDSTWQDRVMKGASPLEIVFENVTAIEDTLPSELKAQFQEFAVDRNKLYSSWLDADIALVKSKDSIRIVLNDKSFQEGSFSPKGFFLLADSRGAMAIPLAQGVKFQSHTSGLNVAADKVIFANFQSPCAGRYILPAPKNVLRIMKGRIEVRGNGLDGSVTGVLKTDATGTKWFCESAIDGTKK